LRWRRLIVAAASALVMPIVWVPAANAGPAPATFVVQGSVEQLAVTHATAGAAVALDDGTGHQVGNGTVDAQGSFLFRTVTAGSGYRVIQTDAGTVTTSRPVKVLSPTFVPPESFYRSQNLQPGFGYITTRDGTKLSAMITLPGPANKGPYPTVIEYSGYDPSNPNDPNPSTLLAQLLGYATVGVNMRGTGCSGGSYSFFEQLQSLDGYDVVEAVAAQPWVKFHKVGLVGISYPGISQLFVAQTQPPHLESIAPLSVIADTWRSTLYPGGIFNNGFALSWGEARQSAGLPYGEGWEQGIVNAGGANGQQCAADQLLRLQNPNIVTEIQDNPYYVASLGDPLAPITFVNKITVPVFLAGAWEDEQVGPQSADMLNAFTSSPSKHFMFTNGTHVDSLFAQLQRWTEFLDFYVGHRIPHVPALFRALAPTIYQQGLGISGMTLPPDRFDKYTSYAKALAAYQAEPEVRVLFGNGSGNPTNPGSPVAAFEHDFSQWPPKETEPTTYYFQPDQQLSSKPPTIPDGDGRASTSYTYDPTAKPATDYSGSSSSIWGANPTYNWLPLPLGKALAFDSAPLTHDVTMVGTGSVNLWLRSTAPDTDLEVTITELRPDGSEQYVQSGWLRASQRKLDPTRTTRLLPWHTNLQSDARPLPAGRFVKVRVELMPFAAVFRKGSRIRITVEAPGGNRPFWTFASLPAIGTVTNSIATSVGNPSAVVLPVIPGLNVPVPLPPCQTLRGEPCRIAYGNAAPTSVHASAAGSGAADVTWVAPSTVRPGDTISGYTVEESPGGAEVSAASTATSANFTGLSAGPHFFSVEADYAGGGTSGVSTPSDTISVTAALLHSIALSSAPPSALLAGVPTKGTVAARTSGTVAHTSGTVAHTSGTVAAGGARSAAAVSSAPTSNATSGSGSLPLTGGDITAICLIGFGLLISGVSLSGARRRSYPYARFIDS
jgi:predicted acyl esterase